MSKNYLFNLGCFYFIYNNMKYLKLYENLFADYKKDKKKLKVDLLYKIEYISTTLIEDFGFELVKNSFSTKKNETHLVLANMSGYVDISHEFIREISLYSNRLSQYGLKLEISCFFNKVRIQKISEIIKSEQVNVVEDSNGLLVFSKENLLESYTKIKEQLQLEEMDCSIQMWIFIK